MFGWIFKNKDDKLENETKKGFFAVKNDIESIGKWIKHLNSQDKQLFEILKVLKEDLSSVQTDLQGLKDAFSMSEEVRKNKQLFENSGVLDKQTAVGAVDKAVQTAVQTGNFYDILKSLTSNERLVILTLLNSEMKLSYEDLALLLGKERATIRGQINAIKQKSEGLIEEMVEKNGKKRVFIPEETKEKLSKYAKVRVAGKKKAEKKVQNE